MQGRGFGDSRHQINKNFLAELMVLETCNARNFTLRLEPAVAALFLVSNICVFTRDFYPLTSLEEGRSKRGFEPAHQSVQ